jgi:ATP-dependent protease ClpP protease subunit
MWEIRQSAEPDSLELYIYGDVTDYEVDWENFIVVESENSANHFREELGNHPDVKQINIFINSCGGSVFEGTAIYNQLKRHHAHKSVFIDGFACSVAAVIATVGDEVIMPRNAMMMIHNIWMLACGNARELRKAADDLDVIMKGNRQAFLQKAGEKLSEEELVQMLDKETWLTAEDCIRFGLADSYAEKEADMTKSAEALQKMNLNLTQRIQINKSLASQLRELTSPALPAPPSPPDPVPALPAQNKIFNLLTALER